MWMLRPHVIVSLLVLVESGRYNLLCGNDNKCINNVYPYNIDMYPFGGGEGGEG